MATQAAEGKKLLAESKYTEAIEQFSKALSTSPTSPDYLIQRSIAYQRAKQYPEALRDAEAAIIHAHARAKRELIIQAQLRRGIALFNLERYGDAQFALEYVKSKDEKEKSVDMWLSKTRGKLSTIKSTEEGSKVSIKEIPDASVLGEVSDSITRPEVLATTSTNKTINIEKIRHDWYQNGGNVFITILAKGVNKDEAVIDIQETSVNISLPIESTGSTYDLTLDPLFAAIDTSKSSSRVLATKIEVTLVKAAPGQKWSALEASETHSQIVSSVPVTQSKPPVYPTSSKSGPKNWDKIATDTTTGEDDAEGDDATKFFKQLYKGASAETQRAMMKSYVESNGTALSTDWNEVSKGPVETLPPDGMESKKWNS